MIGAHGKLPKFVITVLDMDLIEYLDFKGQGFVTMLGNWLKWVVNKFQELIAD